jgi:hypothetical protein
MEEGTAGGFRPHVFLVATFSQAAIIPRTVRISALF